MCRRRSPRIVPGALGAAARAMLACTNAGTVVAPPGVVDDATVPPFADVGVTGDSPSPQGEASVDAGGGDAGSPEGGDVACGSLPPPPLHRSQPVACPTTRPPGLSQPTDAGPVAPGQPCLNDSQCSAPAGGANARCEQRSSYGSYDAGQVCTFDQCFSDTDCPGGAVCQCDPVGGNTCLPSNCRVDSDCACGYCSPDPGLLTSCFPAFGNGVSGYDCRTRADECTSSEACDGGAIGGVCAWQPTVGYWACVSAACAG